MTPTTTPLSVDGSSPAWSVATLEQKKVTVDMSKPKGRKQLNKVQEQIPVMVLIKKKALCDCRYVCTL